MYNKDDYVRIGFWYSEREPDLPHPEPTDYDPAVKQALIDYLEAGEVLAQYRGMSTCRVCGEFNGSADLTDGTFVWPSGLAHYVREHDTSLPDEFVQKVLDQTRSDRLRSRVVDTFRDFIRRHGYELAHVKDGAFMDDSQIMAMFGEMMGQWRSELKEWEEDNDGSD